MCCEALPCLQESKRSKEGKALLYLKRAFLDGEKSLSLK